MWQKYFNISLRYVDKLVKDSVHLTEHSHYFLLELQSTVLWHKVKYQHCVELQQTELWHHLQQCWCEIWPKIREPLGTMITCCMLHISQNTTPLEERTSQGRHLRKLRSEAQKQSNCFKFQNQKELQNREGQICSVGLPTNGAAHVHMLLIHQCFTDKALWLGAWLNQQ